MYSVTRTKSGVSSLVVSRIYSIAISSFIILVYFKIYNFVVTKLFVKVGKSE